MDIINGFELSQHRTSEFQICIVYKLINEYMLCLISETATDRIVSL